MEDDPQPKKDTLNEQEEGMMLVKQDVIEAEGGIRDLSVSASGWRFTKPVVLP